MGRHAQKTTGSDFSGSDIASTTEGQMSLSVEILNVFQIFNSDMDQFSFRGSAKYDHKHRYHYLAEIYIPRACTMYSMWNDDCDHNLLYEYAIE